MIAEVIVDISNSEVDKIFDYQCDDSLKEGYRVLVPFGKREVEGYVVAIKEATDCPTEKLKSIIRMLDAEPVIIEEALQLMRFMKKRYHLRTVDALRLFLPAELRGGKVKELVKIPQKHLIYSMSSKISFRFLCFVSLTLFTSCFLLFLFERNKIIGKRLKINPFFSSKL